MTTFAISISMKYRASDFTKNRGHALRRAPGTKMGVGIGRSDHAKALIAEIATEVKSAKNQSGIQPHKCKTALRIAVWKSTWQSDAINVLDLLADGIKLGLGIDDTWFWIERLDWVMVPEGKERLMVTITQDETGDCWWCSKCKSYQYKTALDKQGRCLSCRPDPKGK